MFLLNYAELFCKIKSRSTAKTAKSLLYSGSAASLLALSDSSAVLLFNYLSRVSVLVLPQSLLETETNIFPALQISTRYLNLQIPILLSENTAILLLSSNRPL